MARIVKGDHRGTEVTLHQWCNDWFTVDELHDVINPAHLQLSPDEVQRVRHSNCGVMLVEYELRDDGTFRKRRRDEITPMLLASDYLRELAVDMTTST